MCAHILGFLSTYLVSFLGLPVSYTLIITLTTYYKKLFNNVIETKL